MAALSGNEVLRIVFVLSEWECARRIRHGGVSEIVKDTGAGPEDQIRERLPRHAEARSEVVFLRMPQGRARRGQRHGCEIIHLRDGKRKSAIGRGGRGVVFPPQAIGDRQCARGLPCVLGEQAPVGERSASRGGPRKLRTPRAACWPERLTKRRRSIPPDRRTSPVSGLRRR